MIDIGIYITAIGILSSIIIAFLIYSLKSYKEHYETMKQNIELQKQVTDLKKEYSDLKFQKDELIRRNNALEHDVPPCGLSSVADPNDYRSTRIKLI